MGINREEVYNKFNGRCAYSGTILESDWQVDHLFPKRCAHFYENEAMVSYYKAPGIHIDCIENLMPCQKIINHYKRGLFIDKFRNSWLGNLHKRLAKLPINPKVQKSINRKRYLLKVAAYFGITKDQPFSGKFYFETIGSTVELGGPKTQHTTGNSTSKTTPSGEIISLCIGCVKENCSEKSEIKCCPVTVCAMRQAK